jgi:hypothetical protein
VAAQGETRMVEASFGYQPELRSPRRIAAVLGDWSCWRIRWVAVSWTYVRGLGSCLWVLWSHDSVWLQRDAGWFVLDALARRWGGFSKEGGSLSVLCVLGVRDRGCSLGRAGVDVGSGGGGGLGVGVSGVGSGLGQ